MQTMYQTMNDAELAAAIDDLEARVAEVKARELKLDMARGKPSPEQVAISRPMLDLLSADSDLTDGGVDCSNYGCFEGIPSARALAGEFLGVDPSQTLVLGSSSLLIEHDSVAMCWLKGTCGHAPWSEFSAAHDGARVKFLCPAPGYDRHFGITEDLGIENVPVRMTENGPDMDEVERLVAADEGIKGIWCVPKYSNPTGDTYSDETVRRLTSMKTAAPDFRIFWDNAYCVHDLYDEGDELLNVFDAACEAGNEDRVIAFASTSKITFPGDGVACMATSEANLEDFEKWIGIQTISYDKVNQQRHVLYLQNRAHTLKLMKKHAAFMKPKFEAVLSTLDREIAPLEIASWSHPKGGYFVSFDAMPGTAKRTLALCKEAGVAMTAAGATFPYGIDPNDSNIRIAPSFPPVEDVEKAIAVFCTCVKMSALEKLGV